MGNTFEEMSLNTSLIAALEKEGITVPTEVQIKAVPRAMENRDIIVQSETGTGKTLAFLLPLFHKLDPSLREMQAIILVPTHELAVQIMRQIERLSQNSDIKPTGAVMIGNVNIDRQVEKLKERPHIIVGTSGRILELIKKKKISAHTVKTIILDEADRLLDDSNIENIKAVIKSTLKERQLMAFSATISREAEDRAAALMKEAEVIRAEEKLVGIPDTLEHICFIADQRDKIEVLRKIVRILNPERAIVFVHNQGNEIEISTSKLKYHGLKAEGIHGTSRKLDRKKTMEDFRAGKIQLLVASDMAARGLHIEGITHIINLNIPEDIKDYVHRAGRAGRNGNKGLVVSIATERELQFMNKHEKALGINIIHKEMYKGVISDAKIKRNV